MKMSFMILEIWLFGFGKVLKTFSKEFIRTLNVGTCMALTYSDVF